MRRTAGVCAATLAVALTAALPAAAPADDADVRYWPLRDINFPVPADKIQAMNPRPSKLRFYAAPTRGPFKLVDERAVTDLTVIDAERNRRGFRYSSPADGEYDFALMFVYPDGDTQPRESELTAQYRIVFDTRPPLVRVATVGTAGVEWDVQDENLKPDGVMVETRWQGTKDWVPAQPRAFKPRDRYTWTGLDPKQPLEVRVIGRDRAGLEMASRVVVLPAAAAGDGLPEVAPAFPGTSLPSGNDVPPRPQIDYVNTKQLTVESKMTRVTRSGVKAAHLWVNDGTSGWKLDKTQPLNITPATPDPTIRIPYLAAKPGLYGFIVIPVNGAGGKQDDPRTADPAQFLIEVDIDAPYVKITGVKVTAGGPLGPKVEINWEAKDKNLMPEPVVLEYAEDKTVGDWKPITPGKVANTGRYVWEVDDKNLWKFYVRASAVDKASNRGEHVYDKEVLIDLETPRAVIDKVTGTGGGLPRVADKAPLAPVPGTPAPLAPPPGPLTLPPPPDILPGKY